MGGFNLKYHSRLNMDLSHLNNFLSIGMLDDKEVVFSFSPESCQHDFPIPLGSMLCMLILITEQQV